MNARTDNQIGRILSNTQHLHYSYLRGMWYCSRSHIKHSCFVFHRRFQTSRNNKSTWASASRFHFGTCDDTFAPVVDIIKARFKQGLYNAIAPCKVTRNLQSRKYYFSCGIHNLSLWNPESSSRNPESRQQLKSGIQVAEDPLQIDPLGFQSVLRSKHEKRRSPQQHLQCCGGGL